MLIFRPWKVSNLWEELRSQNTPSLRLRTDERTHFNNLLQHKIKWRNLLTVKLFTYYSMTCDVPLMYIMYMLTSAHETGSCHFELWHDADNISECFECDSSLNCSKEPSHRNGETVLLSTQDKCLSLRNQVICQLRILIWRSVYFLQENIAMKTADRWNALFKILKSFLQANSDA